MDKIVIHDTSTANWQSLVVDAKNSLSLTIEEDLESYLVFLLMRYLQRPDIASSIIAKEFLEGFAKTGTNKEEALRDVGDKCLLYSGLFPGLARKRRVNISYFVKIGQGAYSSLSDNTPNSLGDLFGELANQFITLMDILHATQELDGFNLVLDPLQAEELYNDTGSIHAMQTLKKFTTNSEHIFLPNNRYI